MSVEAIMEEKLKAAFTPQSLEIENQSHMHAGHAGDPGTGESHFHIHMVAETFEGKNRVARQREVYQVLKAELDGPVHAMALSIKSPSEV